MTWTCVLKPIKQLVEYLLSSTSPTSKTSQHLLLHYNFINYNENQTIESGGCGWGHNWLHGDNIRRLVHCMELKGIHGGCKWKGTSIEMIASSEF